MTPEQIDNLRKIYAASTQGNWEVEDMGPDAKYTWVRAIPGESQIGGTAGRFSIPNAICIAAMHNNFIQMLDTIAKLQEKGAIYL